MEITTATLRETYLTESIELEISYIERIRILRKLTDSEENILRGLESTLHFYRTHLLQTQNK